MLKNEGGRHMIFDDGRVGMKWGKELELWVRNFTEQYY
jgi:hypothetical protein